MIGQFLTAYGL